MLTNELLERRINFLGISNTTEYAYDDNGNLTSRVLKSNPSKVTSYNYNSQNQLVALKEFEGATLVKETQYYYDAVGRRVLKIHLDGNDNSNSFERKYVYDGQEILFELNGNNSLLTTFTHSTLRTDDVLAMDKNNSSYFYLKDHLGTINEIIDGAGNLVQRYVYSPFGKILRIENSAGVEISSTPMVENFYMFTGREYDKESGLYYYRARYYDPALSRFLTVDPDEGVNEVPLTKINKYIYALNNSLFYRDPSGRRAIYDVSDYCGPTAYGQDENGNYKQPANDMDNACKYHDQAYADAGTATNLNWDDSWNRFEGDFRLQKEGIKRTPKQPLKGWAVYVTGVAFMMYSLPMLSASAVYTSLEAVVKIFAGIF